MNNSKHPVRPADASSGGPFSPGIVAEGRFVFVSGQGAFRDGQRISPTSPTHRR
jgi:enamine deaminase RidA (YjgF/YER057c/UK114 family)